MRESLRPIVVLEGGYGDVLKKDIESNEPQAFVERIGELIKYTDSSKVISLLLHAKQGELLKFAKRSLTSFFLVLVK